MRLNGYSYVEGNVLNLVDPSGMVGMFSASSFTYSPLYTAQMLSTGACSLLQQDETPILCNLNVDRIAHIVRGEASGMGTHENQFYQAAAALALIIINSEARIREDKRGSYSFGNLAGFTGTYSAAQNEYQSVPESNGIRLYNIVSVLVGRQCKCNNPLADFSGQGCASGLNRLSDFPDVIGASHDLQYLVDHPTIIYDQSFFTSNLAGGGRDQFEGRPGRGNINTNNSVLTVLGEYQPFMGRIFRGPSKSIIVSNDFNPVPLDWGCEANQRKLPNDGFNPNINRDDNGYIPWAANTTCRTCNNITNWWRPFTDTQNNAAKYAAMYPDRNPSPPFQTGFEWVIVPQQQSNPDAMFDLIRTYGGVIYAAGCG
jgi:hypothetical protein